MLQVANAPCSWGVIENIEGDRYDYARVLDEIAASGYAGTELGDWGFMPTDPALLRAELDKRSLNCLVPGLASICKTRTGIVKALMIVCARRN